MGEEPPTPLHKDAFCQFPFRWIYYYVSNKSTGKETDKVHLCAVVRLPKNAQVFKIHFQDLLGPLRHRVSGLIKIQWISFWTSQIFHQWPICNTICTFVCTPFWLEYIHMTLNPLIWQNIFLKKPNFLEIFFSAFVSVLICISKISSSLLTAKARAQLRTVIKLGWLSSKNSTFGNSLKTYLKKLWCIILTNFFFKLKWHEFQPVNWLKFMPWQKLHIQFMDSKYLGVFGQLHHCGPPAPRFLRPFKSSLHTPSC